MFVPVQASLDCRDRGRPVDTRKKRDDPIRGLPFRLIATLTTVASTTLASASTTAISQVVTIENRLANHAAIDPFPRACPKGAQIAGMPAGHRIERPHWVRNDRTGRWVLWAHYEAKGYGSAQALVATSDRQCGPYTIVRTFRPLGQEVRDDYLFKDDDGAAYFLAASRKGGGANDSMAIFRLTSDYTDVDAAAGTHWVFEHQYREAPVVVKREGIYFLLASQAAGWFPSHAAYITATSMLGPWSPPSFLGNAATFGGQNNYTRSYTGSAGTATILSLAHLGGAVAKDDGNLWLPLLLDAGRRTARLDWYSRYTVDLSTGALGLPDRPDLAAGRPATASTTAGGSAPGNANDGDYRSEWVAASPRFPAWWMVDLGAPKHIGEVDISWWMRKGSEARYAYAIETSSDGVHFVALDRSDNAFFGSTVDTLDVTARYVRIRLTGATMASGRRNWYLPRLMDVRVLS